MNILYFHTASSGLIDVRAVRNEPDIQGQPHMLRLAALLTDADGETVDEYCHIVRLPPGERIHPDARAHHGIGEELVRIRGYSPGSVLSEFGETLGKAGQVVAHSFTYHQTVIDRAFAWIGHKHRPWDEMGSFCTQIKGREYVADERRAPSGGFNLPRFEKLLDRALGEAERERIMQHSDDPVADGMKLVRALRYCHKAIRDFSSYG